MVDLQEIKAFYPAPFHKFERGLLREYLQYQILAIIFKDKVSDKLSFLGGTNLRIVHGINRFSEDLDFDNKGLTSDEFQKLGSFIKTELEDLGYEVQVTFIEQTALHLSIKFPKILFDKGLTNIPTEKILIQIDTFNQGFDYESEEFILDKFDLFTRIKVTPKEIILAQKLWTITQRKRLKGRDFYDALILLQTTQPNEQFLLQKFKVKALSEALDIIQKVIQESDPKSLIDDVRPFLINQTEAEKISLLSGLIDQKLRK